MAEIEKGSMKYIYVFDALGDAYKSKLQEFWKANEEIYHREINSFSSEATGNCDDENYVVNNINNDFQNRISGAIALTESGDIAGEVFLILAKATDSGFDLGELCYYQNIYVEKSYRSYKLMSNLYGIFLANFANSKLRDIKARYLVADNRNPLLKTPFIRKYFIECGFEMKGLNPFGGEVWTKCLINEPFN